MDRPDADAIDAGLIGVRSSLVGGANAAAQAILADPALRGLQAAALARAVGVSVRDARAGIAAVVDMARAVGNGRVGAPLRGAPDLLARVTPWTTTDDALARFASHRGPIVNSAYAHPFLGQAAGIDGATFGYVPSMRLHTEAGDLGDDALTTAAVTLLGYLRTTGCDCSADLQTLTKNFQTAYNADPNVQATAGASIAVDGEYGEESRAALAWTLAQTSGFQSSDAPPACYTPSGPCGSSGGGGSSPSPSPQPAPGPGDASHSGMLTAIGLGAAALGVYLYAKRRKGRR